jgi:hypothetical protein
MAVNAELYPHTLGRGISSSNLLRVVKSRVKFRSGQKCVHLVRAGLEIGRLLSARTPLVKNHGLVITLLNFPPLPLSEPCTDNNHLHDAPHSDDQTV